jgi:hypothetical protein
MLIVFISDFRTPPFLRVEKTHTAYTTTNKQTNKQTNIYINTDLLSLSKANYLEMQKFWTGKFLTMARHFRHFC